ncbi:peptidoglycan recognition family protein [Streptomyces sp. NPDC020965]|uniref:peptidoglycan recognition family protein n=1 Tax=Streptomyces sp. NPDC020965 TaxID=3365105 RepID=UPI0037A369E7
MKLVRRSGWGAPATSAAAYMASARGVKVHYLGSPYASRGHQLCDDYVRKIRAEHLANPTENYSDIAYNMLVCEHGTVYEGRGAHKRTGANGNAALNRQDYAVCALLGSSGLTEPTDAMLNGIRDAIEYLRREGDAGNWIGGHRDGYATACPGNPLYAWVQRGAPRPSPGKPPAPPVPPKENDMAIAKLTEQNQLDVELPDGVWTGLAFAGDSPAVIHAGPRVLVGPTYVQLTFASDTAPDATVTGRFYLTNPDGVSGESGYGDIGPLRASGGVQFLHNINVPAGKHLRFKVRIGTSDGTPVLLTHRTVTGDYAT